MTARVIFPKTLTFRSEELRRAVAKLPCMCCGIEGHTQAAHMNFGKGAAIKASDAALAALCADRPGTRGCHSILDQGGIMDKYERRIFEVDMVVKTYIALVERGLLTVAE